MIHCRPYNSGDFNLLDGYFSRREVNRYINKGIFRLLSLLNLYKCFFRLLIDGDQLIGTGVIRWKYSRDTKRFGWWLYAIWINPDFRGRGLGVVLMENLFKELRLWNVEQVYLTVDNTNTIAQNLYNKLGFLEIIRKDHYIVMRYEL